MAILNELLNRNPSVPYGREGGLSDVTIKSDPIEKTHTVWRGKEAVGVLRHDGCYILDVDFKEGDNAAANALLRHVCEIADKSAVALKCAGGSNGRAKRFLERFGFRATDGEEMTRNPGSPIPMEAVI